jgi:hypothetical protein
LEDYVRVGNSSYQAESQELDQASLVHGQQQLGIDTFGYLNQDIGASARGATVTKGVTEIAIANSASFADGTMCPLNVTEPATKRPNTGAHFLFFGRQTEEMVTDFSPSTRFSGKGPNNESTSTQGYLPWSSLAADKIPPEHKLPPSSAPVTTYPPSISLVDFSHQQMDPLVTLYDSDPAYIANYVTATEVGLPECFNFSLSADEIQIGGLWPLTALIAYV